MTFSVPTEEEVDARQEFVPAGWYGRRATGPVFGDLAIKWMGLPITDSRGLTRRILWGNAAALTPPVSLGKKIFQVVRVVLIYGLLFCTATWVIWSGR